jgi:hypothetical protein
MCGFVSVYYLLSHSKMDLRQHQHARNLLTSHHVTIYRLSQDCKSAVEWLERACTQVDTWVINEYRVIYYLF